MLGQGPDWLKVDFKGPGGAREMVLGLRHWCCTSQPRFNPWHPSQTSKKKWFKRGGGAREIVQGVKILVGTPV